MPNVDIKQAIETLKKGRVVIMPTDTIYGIVGLALNKETVEKIYYLRNRKEGKPMIILISTLEDLNLFNIKLTKKQKDFLNNNWPNPLSVIFESINEEFEYLHRGNNSLAFRLPKLKWLQNLLKQTGPLVAPSANLSGMKAAENIEDAKKYFGGRVALYLDMGNLRSQPSTLVKFSGNKVITLRQGTYNLDE